MHARSTLILIGLLASSGCTSNNPRESCIEGQSIARACPSGKTGAAWTGQEMIVWGGQDYAHNTWRDDGARYDPQTDTWSPLPDLPANAPVVGPAAVWTGAEMLLWGGVQDAVGLSYVP